MAVFSSLILVAFAWQAVAAWTITYAERWDVPPPRESEEPIDALVDREARTGDVHAVKLTEACVRLARAGKPEFLRAARDWCDRVRAPRASGASSDVEPRGCSSDDRLRHTGSAA